jgi:TolB-like protein
MARDVFISYSSIDKEAADAVCSILEENGILCWIAPRDITPGIAFSEAIIDAIKSSKVFILVYSSNSNNSAQVIREVDRAVHRGLAIITLRLEDVQLSKQLEYYVSSVHWLDAMTSPLEKHLNKLLNVVQILLKPEEVKDVEIAEALRKGIIKQKESVGIGKRPNITKRRTILVSGILLVVVIAIVSLIVFNIGSIKQARSDTIESVVVLPFSNYISNYTGANELETLVSGMHTCLITNMSQLSGLKVINSTTSRVYKNVSMSVQDIANELNIDAVIEASVFGIQDSIVIQVSLIRAFPEEEMLWTNEYKEEKGQILNLYNRITKQIAGEIKIKLTTDEERILAESRTVDPEALVAYMKGRFHWERLGLEDLDSALHYFQVANDKDPDWADPYAGMSMTWQVLGSFGYAPLNDSYVKASEYMDKALELDPNTANSHYVEAITAVWKDWDWKKGETEFLKALELNPSDALCRIYYAHLLMILGRIDESKYQANLALELDPFMPLVLGLYAKIMNTTGNYQAALTQAQKALSVDPDNKFAIEPLAEAYLATGDTLKWHEFMKNRWYWADDNYLVHLDSIFQKGGYLAVIEDRIRVNEEVLSKGGSIPYTGLAQKYLIMKNVDKAMDYLEEAYETQYGFLAYVSTYSIYYPQLKDNLRYIAILEKMNLPLLNN